MKKSELKTNMLVETRDGKRFLVKKDLPIADLIHGTGDTDLFVRGISFMNFYEYTEDLFCYEYNNHHVTARNYDIMKVYTPCKISAFILGQEFDLDNYKLLWAREEPKDEPKEDPEIQELCKMIESIEWALAEIKTVLERKEKENDN